MRRGLRSFVAAEQLEDRRLLAASEVLLFDFEDSELHDQAWLAAQPVGTAALYVTSKGDSGDDLLKLAPGEGRNGSQALLVESTSAAMGLPGFYVLKNRSAGGRLDSIWNEEGYLAPRGTPVNRLGFWVRFDEGFRVRDAADPKNLNNFVVGTYHFDPGKIGVPGGDRVVESDNWHFYYQLMVQHDLAGNEWIHVVLNTTPTHQRSLSGDREAVDPTQPRGSMWELATRFYIDMIPYFGSPEIAYPVRMWVDDIRLFYEPDPYQMEVRIGNYMEGEMLDVAVGQTTELPVQVTNRGTEAVTGRLVTSAYNLMKPTLLDPATQRAPESLTVAPGETRKFLFRLTPDAKVTGQTHGSGVIFIPDAEARPKNFSKSSPHVRLNTYYGTTGPADATTFGAWMKAVVKPARENHAPRIQGGLAISTGPDRVAQLRLNARDAEGDPVTFELRSQANQGGRVSLDPETGLVTFVPDVGFTGVVPFNYGASDGKEPSFDARSWFLVDPGFNPPLDPSGLVPRNDMATVALATGAKGTVGQLLLNDEGGPSLSVVRVDGRAKLLGDRAPGNYGDFFIQPDGRFEYRIVEGLPSLEFLGLGESLTDSMAYEVTNGVESRAAILRVTIEGRNHPPRARDDQDLAVRGFAASQATGNLLANDSDPDGAPLRVVELAGKPVSDDPLGAATTARGVHGTFQVRGDGSYQYFLDESAPAVARLAEGEQLQDAVEYRVSDGLDTAAASLSVLITAPPSLEGRKPVSIEKILDFDDAKLHDEPWLLTQPAGTAVPYISAVGNGTARLDVGGGRNGSNAVLVEAADPSQGAPAAMVLKNLKGAKALSNLPDDRGYLLPRGQRANRLEFWVRFDDRLRQLLLANGDGAAQLKVVTYHYDPAKVTTRVVESDNWSFTHNVQVRLDEAGQEWVHVVLAPNPDSQRDNPVVGWNPTLGMGEYWELLTRFSVELLPPAGVESAGYPLRMWIDDVALSYVEEADRVQVEIEGFLPGQILDMASASTQEFRVTLTNRSDKPVRGTLRVYGSSVLMSQLFDPVTLLPWAASTALGPGEKREGVLRLSVLFATPVNSTGVTGIEFATVEELRPANRSQTDSRVQRVADGGVVPPADASVNAATLRVRVVAAAAAKNSRPTVEAGQLFETSVGEPLRGQLVSVDPESDVVQFVVLEPPGRGRLELDSATGQFTFIPEPGFRGTVRWKYTAADAGGIARAGVSWIRVDEKVVEARSPGDANRDGLFTTSDLVLAFQAGKYEDGVSGGTTWEEGDWNGDGEFNTSDLVLAFQGGQFEVPAAARPRAFREAGMLSDWGSDQLSGMEADRSTASLAAGLSSELGTVTDAEEADWLDELAAGWLTGPGRAKSLRDR